MGAGSHRLCTYPRGGWPWRQAGEFNFPVSPVALASVSVEMLRSLLFTTQTGPSLHFSTLTASANYTEGGVCLLRKMGR